MSPDQFLASLKSRAPEPVYLFIGPDGYTRDQCRKALLEKVLPDPDSRADGFTRLSLDQASIAEMVDDARSMSLFASERLIWASSAEAAVPRDAASKEGPTDLEAYLTDPSPGVVLVIDCSRFQFDGDDKTKIERVRKYFASIKAQVEFAPLDSAAAHKLARDLAKKSGVQISEGNLDLLVDVLDADATRIATELEKLATYAGESGKITEEAIWSLVPNARATTIFALVEALGRRNRNASLDALDLLVKEGEYLPLALTFLATQFRLALAAREAGATSASQIQAHFSKLGVAMWRSRAEQIGQTLNAFPTDRLRAGIEKIYETDKALRDTRPDDRTIMERFVLSLT